MPASGIAAVSVDFRSQFLDGLSPADRKTILAAATQRRFGANSVITNQGHPADSSFPADQGPDQILFRYRAGQEASLSVAWTRRSIRRSDCFVQPFFLSFQHRNGSGQFGVGVGSPHNPRPCHSISPIARKHVDNCVRLRGLATRVPYRFSLSHRSTAGCSSTRHSRPHHRSENSRWRYAPDHKRGFG